MDPKKNIKQYLASGETERAIDEWMDSISHCDPYYNELILQKCQFAQLSSDHLRGLLAEEEARTRRTKIVYALLELLKQWEPGGEKDALYQLLDHIQFSKINKGPLLLYNCDRNRAYKQFRKKFNDHQLKKQAFQFYFLPGCPDQMPDSFAKRMIFQLIEDEYTDNQQYNSDNQDKMINFPLDEFDQGRVKIEKLPLGSDVEAGKRKFKSYVQRRFHFVDTQSFEAFIETGVPKLEYDYVVNIFELYENDWQDDDGEIQDYLQWMINTFQCAHPDIPVFMFFFIVRMRNFHQEHSRSARQNLINSQVASLCEKNPAAVIKELTPVDPDDLEEWMRTQAGITRHEQIRDLMAALIQNLGTDEKKHYDRTNQFHMKDIESLQRAFYERLNSN